MKLQVIVLCTVLAMIAVTAQAIPTSWTEDIELVTAPTSLQVGDFESSTDIRLMYEQQNYLLTDDLMVNIVTPGSYDFGTYSDAPVWLAAGQSVASYILHFDPVAATLLSLSGMVTFDQRILGVMVLNDALNRSDPRVGATGTTYPTRSHLSGGDSLQLEVGMQSISLTALANAGVDQVRIITAVSDFSDTMLLLGLALLGIAGASRLLRRQAI